MQRTRAVQDAEVSQYLAEQKSARSSAHQRQREALETARHSGTRRPPQHGRSWSGPPLRAKSGYDQLDRGTSSFRQPESCGPAYSRRGINGTSFARLEWTLPAGYRRKSFSTQEQALRPIGSGSREGHWQCSKCKQRYDPLGDTGRCGACDWPRWGRP